MGGFIERIGERKKGISVVSSSGYTNEADIRLGDAWFGEVTKLGGSEALRWTSEKINFFTQEKAVNELAGILTGKSNLLIYPSGYQIKVNFFLEPKQGYAPDRDFEYPYSQNPGYRTLRRECRRVNDGRKISVEHAIKYPNGNLVFALKTVTHPPHEVSELTLKIADEYAEKWPDVYSWISSCHVNREKFAA